MKEVQWAIRWLKALVHIIIPILKEEFDYIDTALEERERSEHFSSKLVKKMIE